VESLDVLQTELKAIGPKVATADDKILAALAEKVEASDALENAKAKVRKLKAIRDPLRIQQMQIQQIVGGLDPGTPPSQTISNGDG